MTRSHASVDQPPVPRLLIALAATGLSASSVRAAQTDAEQSVAAVTPAPAPSARKKSPYQPEGVPRSGRTYLAVTAGRA